MRAVISATVLMLIAAGLAVFLAVLSILIGVLGAQRGQRAIYYAMRRQAQEQASKRYTFAFWCVLLAGVLFAISRIVPSDAVTENVAPLQTAAPLALANAADTAVVEATTTSQDVVLSAELITTPTLEATAASATALTPTLEAPGPALPTPTLAVVPAAPAPTAPATPVSESTAESPADPATIIIAPNQQLALRAIGTGWDANGTLQGVSTEFPVGTKTIYVFFNYLDVPRGTLLRHTWLQDGKSVSFSSVTFNKLGQGTEAVSWAPKGGFQAGLYEVRVNLGNAPQFVANFLVR